MHQDLTKGSIIKTLIKLSVPTTIAFFLQSAFNIVDTIFVGRLGAKAIAAVTIVFPAIFLLFALSGGIGVGTNSLISRYLGAKQKKEAGKAAFHSYILSAIIGLAVYILSLFFSKPLFKFIGASNAVLPMALAYSRWIFLGSIFMMIGMASSNILRAQGDMKTPMKGMILGIILNVILDPLLIFGIGFFPKLGVEGAALATVISRLFSFIYITYYANKSKLTIKTKITSRYFMEILKVGLPTSINNVIMSAGIMILTKIIASFGDSAVAAFGLGFRFDSIAFMPGFGISIAVVTIVGHNIGAKKFRRAKTVSWLAALISGIAMECIGLLLFLFPKAALSIFTSDPAVILIGILYLKTIGLSYGFIGISMMIASAFQGSGAGIPAIILSSLRLFIISVPLAIILSKLFGIIGIFIAITVSTVITAIVAILWFLRTNFRKYKIQPIPTTHLE